MCESDNHHRIREEGGLNAYSSREDMFQELQIYLNLTRRIKGVIIDGLIIFTAFEM
jgi:hypothetical protein